MQRDGAEVEFETHLCPQQCDTGLEFDVFGLSLRDQQLQMLQLASLLSVKKVC